MIIIITTARDCTIITFAPFLAADNAADALDDPPPAIITTEPTFFVNFGAATLNSVFVCCAIYDALFYLL